MKVSMMKISVFFWFLGWADEETRVKVSVINISSFFLCFYGGQGRRNKDEGKRENQCFFWFLGRADEETRVKVSVMNISGFFLCFYGRQRQRNKDEGERDENQCFFCF